MELEDAEIGALAPPSLTLPRKGGGNGESCAVDEVGGRSASDEGSM